MPRIARWTWLLVLASSSPAWAQADAPPTLTLVEVSGVDRGAVLALQPSITERLVPCGSGGSRTALIQVDGEGALSEVRFDGTVRRAWSRCARRALAMLRYPPGPGTISLQLTWPPPMLTITAPPPGRITDLSPPVPEPAPRPIAPAPPASGVAASGQPVDGPLTADAIAAVVARESVALGSALVPAADDVSTTIELELRVRADGAVSAARATAGPDRLASMALRAVRRWRFPAQEAPSTVRLRVDLAISARP
jgi:hypothetical protein